jgi:5-methylcytosine-specific restriction endonuclease McrA
VIDVAYKVKICLVCGKEYLPTVGTQKYCANCHLIVTRIRAAKWTKENPERHRANNARWYKENSERVRASNTKWREANPGKDVVKCSKRRAAKYANTPISELLTSTEWLAILAEANGHCAYCGKEAKLTLDHVVPLARGGKHSKDNVVPACNHCNCSKGKKTVEEWIRTTGKVLRDMNTQEATI